MRIYLIVTCQLSGEETPINERVNLHIVTSCQRTIDNIVKLDVQSAPIRVSVAAAAHAGGRAVARRSHRVVTCSPT